MSILLDFQPDQELDTILQSYQFSNWLSFIALQVTVGVSLELSVATGSVQITNAVDLLRSVSIVWLVGQITEGASVSVKESQ